MDLQSYIQLKEAYVNLNAPKVELTEEEIWVEVEAFAQALVEEEGLDLSDMTWDEVREAYLDEAENGLFGLGRMAGQVKRAGAKMFGNATQRNDAVSYEKSYNDINQRRGEGVGTRKTVTKGEIDAETAGRRRADPNYKPGQGVGSGQKLTVKPTETTKKETPKTETPKTETPNTKPAQTTTQKAAPAAPAKDRMADASKADRMSAWAKANPKLAAAQKQRASTRGTSATTNPLMKDLKKRMPKPAAPAKSPSLTGNKASTSMSSGGAKAVSPTAKPQPVTKNTSVTGNKLSNFSSSGGAKATAPKPAAAKPAAAKPVAAKRPLTTASAPKTGAAATKALNKFTEEVDVFDTILAHLIEQGFGDDEALILMTSMSEEKRQQMLALISEEGADAMKDKQLENGGHASRSDYNRPTRNPATGDKKKGETPLQKAAKEKYGKGASAMDIVRAKIKAQHGDKAIKDTKKD